MVFSAAADASSVRYRVGSTLLFRIQEQPTNRCCCQPSGEIQVLGWRLVDSCGKEIRSVTYAAPISASSWQGRWPEIGIDAVDKAAAQAEAAGPGAIHQAWQKVMSTYRAYWEGVETPISPGCYTLYVDTTIGTLSRCLWLYNPINRCPSGECCGYCVCEQASVQVGCCCRATLQVSFEQPPRYRSLSWQPFCSCQRP